MLTLKILFLFNFLNFVNSQNCANVPIMQNFSISEYAKGIWYLQRHISTLETSLSVPCSQVTPSESSSKGLDYSIRGWTPLWAFGYTIDLIRRGPGVYDWKLENLSFQNLVLKNLTMQVNLIRIY